MPFIHALSWIWYCISHKALPAPWERDFQTNCSPRLNTCLLSKNLPILDYYFISPAFNFVQGLVRQKLSKLPSNLYYTNTWHPPVLGCIKNLKMVYTNFVFSKHIVIRAIQAFPCANFCIYLFSSISFSIFPSWAPGATNVFGTYSNSTSKHFLSLIPCPESVKGPVTVLNAPFHCFQCTFSTQWSITSSATELPCTYVTIEGLSRISPSLFLEKACTSFSIALWQNISSLCWSTPTIEPTVLLQTKLSRRCPTFPHKASKCRCFSQPRRLQILRRIITTSLPSLLLKNTFTL